MKENQKRKPEEVFIFHFADLQAVQKAMGISPSKLDLRSILVTAKHIGERLDFSVNLAILREELAAHIESLEERFHEKRERLKNSGREEGGVIQCEMKDLTVEREDWEAAANKLASLEL